MMVPTSYHPPPHHHFCKWKHISVFMTSIPTYDVLMPSGVRSSASSNPNGGENGEPTITIDLSCDETPKLDQPTLMAQLDSTQQS